MSGLKVKICGMKDPGNAEAISSLMPDYMGFIFYPPSPRFVGHKPDPALFSTIPDEIEKVAVFVNASVDTMLDITDPYGIQHLQLHGDESPELCMEIRNRGKKVIKALSAEKISVPGIIDAYRSSADYLLFDTPTKQYGGSGRKFDWSVLTNLEPGIPFFLSGGIKPGDADEIQEFRNTFIYGIDVNSGFETGPGIKDQALLQTFIKEIRDGI